MTIEKAEDRRIGRALAAMPAGISAAGRMPAAGAAVTGTRGVALSIDLAYAATAITVSAATVAATVTSTAVSVSAGAIAATAVSVPAAITGSLSEIAATAVALR